MPPLSLQTPAIAHASLNARAALVDNPSVSAYRVLHGDAEGVPGVVIEHFGDVLVVQIHEGKIELTEADVRALAAAFHRELGTRAVYKKIFVSDRTNAPRGIEQAHRDAKPWLGEPVEPELTVLEHGLRFIVRPYDGFSVGLFLDHRENRRRIRELTSGRRVLNLFSYTCAFSVAAAAGGASHVSSVDLSKRYLEWGKRNFEINGIDLAPHAFFCSDVFEFYKRAERQGRRFDLVVLDPPTFGRARRPKREFVLDEQLDDLCRGAVSLLDPAGVILLSTNTRSISHERLEAAIRSAAGNHTCTVVERPAPPVDFAGDLDYAKSVIARFD